MKIKNNIKTNVQLLADLDIGDIFVFNEGNYIPYMVLDKYDLADLMPENEDEVLDSFRGLTAAVCLQTAGVALFSDETEVIKVETTLTLENKI